MALIPLLRSRTSCNLARPFLTDLTGEVRRPVTTVEAGDVGVGLFEDGVLGRRDGQVAHDVERMPAADRPSGNDGDDDLGHETDQALDLEDVEAAGSGRVDRLGGVTFGVPVAGATPDSLISAGAEGPTTVLGRGTVPGEQYAPDVGRHPRMVEAPVELVDGMGPKGVANLGSIERHPNRTLISSSVIGDVGQLLEAGDCDPAVGIEQLGHHGTSVAMAPEPAAIGTVFCFDRGPVRPF